MKEVHSSLVHPNCLCASSAMLFSCSSLTHVVVYAINSSIFVIATPFMDIALRNSSLEVTALRGIVNSLTPSFGK